MDNLSGTPPRRDQHPFPAPISVLVSVRSFIESDVFENNVSFDNTAQIYLINCIGN